MIINTKTLLPKNLGIISGKYLNFQLQLEFFSPSLGAFLFREHWGFQSCQASGQISYSDSERGELRIRKSPPGFRKILCCVVFTL